MLAWVAPAGLQAQLPDAPSAAKLRGNAPSPVKKVTEKGKSSSESTGSAAPSQDENLNLKKWEETAIHPIGSAQSADYSKDDNPGGQQSIYTPTKQSILGPGPSSSTASTRPIPGSAPVLYNACPKNTCSAAQSIMCCGRAPSPFARYLKRPNEVPMTARDNLRSAVKDIIDPFNLMTIGADAAFGIATNSHTPYGPGFHGISEYAGVSMTEDLTGEFFGTFLVPSLMHQDPHYHREPFVSIKRRVWHAITQVVWTQDYSGHPMLNYANVFGGIATAVVSNTFVPGPGRQGWKNTSERLSIAFATSPSSNLIEEFVPDLASHINLHVVIFQRILNSVAIEEGGQP